MSDNTLLNLVSEIKCWADLVQISFKPANGFCLYLSSWPVKTNRPPITINQEAAQRGGCFEKVNWFKSHLARVVSHPKYQPTVVFL